MILPPSLPSLPAPILLLKKIVKSQKKLPRKIISAHAKKNQNALTTFISIPLSILLFSFIINIIIIIIIIVNTNIIANVHFRSEKLKRNDISTFFFLTFFPLSLFHSVLNSEHFRTNPWQAKNSIT